MAKILMFAFLFFTLNSYTRAETTLEPILPFSEEQSIFKNHNLKTRWDIEAKHLPDGIRGETIDRCLGYYRSLKEFLNNNSPDYAISILFQKLKKPKRVDKWAGIYTDTLKWQLSFPSDQRFSDGEASIIDARISDGVVCATVTRCVEKSCSAIR